MKANIKKSKVSSDSGIILSIGMIVKNEEKVLRRCLESLQPLMKAIPSELIIADTGSTDSTVEIAKEFTDNVFHFEWINDFAAARNSTLEKAKGQWFMFIDADEYLDEDIGEMVHFFNIPELRSKYKTLEIMVRSYTDEAKIHYQDGCLPRFQRIDDPDDKVHFVGAVHEGIWIRYPLGYFSTLLHHTGYCYSSAQQNVNKKNRNHTLMVEEYKKDPTDIRMLSHLIDGSEGAELEKYMSEALALVRKDRKHLYANVVYMQTIFKNQNSKPEYALELCDEYYNCDIDVEKCVATVAVVLLKAKILSALARYEEAYKTFEKYIELYNKYKNDELDLTDSSAHPIIGVTENEYIQNTYFIALTLSKLKRYDDAFGLLNQFDVAKLDGETFRGFLGTVRELCKGKKDYTQLARYYEKSYNLPDQNKKSLSLYMMESTYYSLPTQEERDQYAEDIVNSCISGMYADLMKLILEQEDTTEYKTKLLDFIDSVEDWTDGYSEAIYLAVKYKLDISGAVSRMKSDKFRGKLEELAYAHDDFAGFVHEYGTPASYMQSIKLFYWITSLYEKASYRSFEMRDNERYELYLGFTVLLGDYVKNIYNSELLNDDDIEILPPLHKFGFFMSRANQSLEDGDSVGYIKEMKKALVNCESMKEIVQFMLEQFKKKIR